MRTDQDEPLANQHFPRRWFEPTVTGTAVSPDAAFVWYAADVADRQDSVRRATPAWRRAERQWARAVRT